MFEDSFVKRIGKFDSLFELKQGALRIELSSPKETTLLAANYAFDNMPSQFKNILDLPSELF